MTRHILRVFPTIGLSAMMLLLSVGGVSAQPAGALPPEEATVPHTAVADSPAGLSATHSLLHTRSTAPGLALSDHALDWQTRSSSWTAGRRAVARAGASSRTTGSRLRKILIGAGIGGGVGAAVGTYYAEATGDGAYPQAIPAFAGIGAAIGAVAGFVVGLF